MRILLVLAVGLLLSACSSSSPAPKPKSAAPQAAASTRHVKTPWDNLVKDENKAKAVQQTVNAAAKRQQQAIEKQSQ